MLTQNQIENLPAGSTIILATTSPDKRSEYENIFKRFDVNFIFLDDLGLSPQKTDEMTNTYDGNLIQKACEISLALHTNKRAIKDRLSKAGFNTDYPIIGMVEDSGIAIYPKDPTKRDGFNLIFKRLLEQKIHTEFENNPELKSRTFPQMSDDEIDEYLYCAFQNSKWMVDIGVGNQLPGPNFKPIFETLKGGMREIFDIMHTALEELSDSSSEKQSIYERRHLRFRNHCSIMFVEPLANPISHLTAEDIVIGENKGWLKSRQEVDDLFEARCNPEEIRLQAGEFFTGDMLVPDGQKDTSNYSQQELINEGMLWTKNNKRANYYRLAAVGELKEKYNLPIAPRYKYKERFISDIAPSVMVLYGGNNKPDIATQLENKLESKGFIVLENQDNNYVLSDPEARLMGSADIAFILAGDDATEIENSQLILGAVVDKQVMPSAKEKCIIVLNARKNNGDATFDESLSMIRHAKMAGLKNGLSEVNDIIEYNADNYKINEIYAAASKILKKEYKRKKHRLTNVEPIQPKKNIAPKKLPSISFKKFSVFVAGGAANEYLEFKAPSNQLGRFIHNRGWVLVTGAGQKDGPMGAVHSGFAEAYINKVLQIKNKKDREFIKEIIDNKITNILIRRKLTGNMAMNFHADVMQAVYAVPDAEFLAHEAPEVLLYLLQPKRDTRSYKTLGSLKDAGGMVGYSMPPLLISEGSGKWPMGMQGHNAGNMQRRMYEMLKSSAHVFLTGGQGTYQELVESVKLAIEQKPTRDAAGLKAKPIYILNQDTYKNGIYSQGGSVFRPALADIDKNLANAKLSRKDIGLEVFSNMRKLEARLKNYAGKYWDGDKEATISHIWQ